MIHPLLDEQKCPRCGSNGFKLWTNLSDEELFAALRMPASAEFTESERRKHRICTRCWFEQTEKDIITA